MAVAVAVVVVVLAAVALAVAGTTVVSEVRGYCLLKAFPNTPQDDVKYSRLCKFRRSIRCLHTLSPRLMRIKPRALICVEVLTVRKDGPSTERPCKDVKYIGANLADNETGYTTENITVQEN